MSRIYICSFLHRKTNNSVIPLQSGRIEWSINEVTLTLVDVCRLPALTCLCFGADVDVGLLGCFADTLLRPRSPPYHMSPKGMTTHTHGAKVLIHCMSSVGSMRGIRHMHGRISVSLPPHPCQDHRGWAKVTCSTFISLAVLKYVF